MKYPVPLQSHRYLYHTEVSQNNNSINDVIGNTFSWNSESKLLLSYRTFINSRLHFLKHIPFIHQIFLCNSITFNALHPGSDIDIFIITKPGYLRYARLWSWIFFSFQNLKRTAQKGDHSYKFCLSFYVDINNINITHLRQKEGDIYLPYRVAHTVLLYTDQTYDNDYFYKQNKKLLSYIPYHPLHQTIQLGTNIYKGSSYIKRTLEYIGTTWLGRLLQKIISYIRKIIINKYKISYLPHHHRQYIIVNDTMLKFHGDKRTIYHHHRKNN